MNTPVNFETAKLLKEKGFEGIKSFLWYYKDGTLHITPTEGYKGLKCWNTWDATQGVRWDAPTITEVVMWLYEKHWIWIRVSAFERDVFYPDIFDYKKEGNTAFSKNAHIMFATDEMKRYSPTEAYQFAITYTLKNLI